MAKLRKLISVILSILIFTAIVPCALAADGIDQAKDIAEKCDFESSKFENGPKWLYDNNLKSRYYTEANDTENYLEIVFPEGENVQGLYILWEKYLGEWDLWCSFGGEYELVGKYGAYGFVQEYVDLPEGATGAKIVISGEGNYLSILELEVYTQGELPESVHIWSKAPETVDFLVISTHQDDEVLFFGGAIPYFTGEKNIDTLVVYMTFDQGRRLHEACNALWYGGCRYHPEFAMFPDKYSKTIDDARKAWDEDEVTAYLTKLVLSTRPTVILSQHTGGEYGHGQHQLTVHCLINAVENAANDSIVAQSYSQYKSWNTPKFYIHGHPDDYSMKILWDEIILESMGGITALDAAKKSFKIHESQNYDGGFQIHYNNNRKSDCTLFKLYRSNVGEDIANNDFFENVNLRAGYAEISQNDLAYIAECGEFEKISDKNLYRVNRDNTTAYIRYCENNGVADWYISDENGTILEPTTVYSLVPVEPIVDDPVPSDSDIGKSDSCAAVESISTVLSIVSVAAIVVAVVLLIRNRKKTK